MLLWAYFLIAIALCKIIVDLVDPGLFAVFSLWLDVFIFLLLLGNIIRTSFLQKQGKREKLKEKVAQLEKNLTEVHEE
jgi:hypothetical protein